MIYAEGAPAETLLNVGEFAVNFAEYFRLLWNAARAKKLPAFRSFLFTAAASS